MTARPETAATAIKWQIGDWRVAPAINEIGRDGETLRIEPKAMEVLIFLADRAGQVVSRDELLSALWPGVVVGDDALSQAVIKLRKALRDPAKSPQYIDTIPKRGYRLVAPANRIELARPAEPAQQGITAFPAPPPRRARSSRVALIGGLVVALLLAGAALHFVIDRNDAPALEMPAADDLTVDRSGALPTVAVVAFEAQGDDAEQAYLARGIAAHLMTDLARISGLRVIGLSPFARAEPQPTAGRTAIARYVVSGSLHRASGALKINVRLIDTASGQLLWAERYERPSRDLAAIEEEMVGRLVNVLPVKISESERRQLARRYTRNPEAYEHFLRGQAAFLARTESENDAAKPLLRKAIELDPAFARAYASLALTYLADYRSQWTSDGPRALAKSMELANTALQIDPSIPDVYVVLAYVHSVRREHVQAIKYLQQAIELDRSYADAYAYLGAVYTHVGQPERTVPLLRTAMRLNADAGFIYFLVLGRAYFFQGVTEQATINLREALARNPADLETRIFMAANLVASGNLDAAKWEAEEIRNLQPGFATTAWLQTFPMVDAGMKQKLIGLLSQIGL